MITQLKISVRAGKWCLSKAAYEYYYCQKLNLSEIQKLPTATKEPIEPQVNRYLMNEEVLYVIYSIIYMICRKVRGPTTFLPFYSVGARQPIRAPKNSPNPACPKSSSFPAPKTDSKTASYL